MRLVSQDSQTLSQGRDLKASVVGEISFTRLSNPLTDNVIPYRVVGEISFTRLSNCTLTYDDEHIVVGEISFTRLSNGGKTR